MINAATRVDQLCVDTIRTLSMDAVQRANSGHPGTPMALAPLGYRLFTRHMKHDPATPDWFDRDRFVLSCGHASMLLYSLLYLTGYPITLDDIRNFRQLGSPTAGHPEHELLPGVETTTGPLGQGFANAVGMALAERMLAERFNTPDAPVVDHFTWVLASDGDLMEGVQAEAASIAGHLGLGRLIVFWDDNRISIDGSTDVTFTEDVAARFAAYGWQVLRLDDVDDLEAIDAVVEQARADDARPTLVVTRTHIGIGSPLQDTAKAHGAPLGEENVRLTKRAYGWPEDEHFLVPDEVLSSCREVCERGAEERAAWTERLQRLRSSDRTRAERFEAAVSGQLPDGWSDALDGHSFDPASALATRQASEVAINLVAPHVPSLAGGSADLAESNLTTIRDGGWVQRGSFAGRNIHFGVREHGMAAITNGITVHGGLRGYCGTFLIFSDYMRPSIRLAALMRVPSIFVFTHDSVWLGEDGPTHQPIEQAASLRAMPNLLVLRPAEASETLQAWKVALEQRSRPTALLLTRQKLHPIDTSADDIRQPDLARGAYVLREPASEPALVLLATGSEVQACVEAARALGDELPTRVVSMPSWELFGEQPPEYRQSVLGSSSTPRLAVEAGATFGWERWTGDRGDVLGIDRFGVSAPGEQAAAALGISVENIVARARALA